MLRGNWRADAQQEHARKAGAGAPGMAAVHTSLICWLTSLVWATVRPAARPAAAPPSPGSSFSFSNSWTRCIFNSVMKGTSFSCRILHHQRGRFRGRKRNIGSGLSLFSLIHIHLPSLTSCPDYFRIHQMQSQQLYPDCLSRSYNYLWSNPYNKSLMIIYLLVVLFL